MGTILKEILSSPEIWTGKDFSSIEIEDLSSDNTTIFGSVEARNRAVTHHIKIRNFQPSHAIETPNKVFLFGQYHMGLNGKEIILAAPIEGWYSIVLDHKEAFIGLMEEEFYRS